MIFSAQHISKAKCISAFCEAVLGIKKKATIWVAEGALEVLDDSHVKSSGQHS